MRKKRHNYTHEEKVHILKRYLVERIPVSDTCEEHRLQPTLFYGWQQRFFENGATAFIRDDRDAKDKAQRSFGILRRSFFERMRCFRR
jgi:transposase-like protein